MYDGAKRACLQPDTRLAGSSRCATGPAQAAIGWLPGVPDPSRRPVASGRSTGAPLAAAASGAPVDLPEATGRRDGSGVPGSQPIAACAGPVAHRIDPATRVSG